MTWGIIIQRPTAAQLLEHPFIKRMKKESGLKEHKLPFDRCQYFQKGRQKVHKEPNLARHRYILNISACSDGIATCYIYQFCSDLPTIMWDFDNQMADQSVREASV